MTGLLLCEPCIKSAVRTTCHKCILTIEMDGNQVTFQWLIVHNMFIVRHQADCWRERVSPELLRVLSVQRQAGECVRQQGRGVLLRELLPDTLREKMRRMRESRDDILIEHIFYFILQVILGEGLRFGEQNYHRTCFKCSVCDQALAQGAAHSIKVDKTFFAF